MGMSTQPQQSCITQEVLCLEQPLQGNDICNEGKGWLVKGQSINLGHDNWMGSALSNSSQWGPIDTHFATINFTFLHFSE